MNAVAKPRRNLNIINIFMIHFYCYNSEKIILVSDFPVEKVRNRFGHNYEILNSIKDKTYLDQIQNRVVRQYPNFQIKHHFITPRNPHTEETKRKMAEAKLGKPRDEQTKQKISNTLKGRSNFQGKRHTEETKQKMREVKLGNKAVKDYYWAQNPDTGEEIRIKSRQDIPPGFKLGRDYYSVEPGLYYLNHHKRSQE